MTWNGLAKFRRTFFFRYGVAVVITVTALGLKLLIKPRVAGDMPFLVFFAAVIASAVIGGMGPGLLAAMLASVLEDYFFTPPLGHLGFEAPGEPVRVTLFLLESAFVSMICSRLRAARERVEAAAAEARELERRILEIDDEEQRRIGHDLHDGLGQQLTGLAMMSRRLENRLSSANSPEASEAAKVSELAKNAVELAHDLCRTLSPPALESAGLAEALRELAANAESIFRVECIVDEQGGVKPPPVGTGVHLYRIAQEAISNAVRHGKAKHVEVRLRSSSGVLLMQIADDGSGIDPAAASMNGMGLRIMRYRARMIGAQIDIRHRQLGGTEVLCRYDPNNDHATKHRGNSHAKAGANGSSGTTITEN
jgi:signal transduction histidine kinase